MLSNFNNLIINYLLSQFSFQVIQLYVKVYYFEIEDFHSLKASFNFLILDLILSSHIFTINQF